jgi:hypothetical protein
MKLNIKYPPLVEQSYSFMIATGIKITKDTVYKNMVDSGLIDENGNPTQTAIDEGLIEAAGDNLIKQFKAANPSMASIPDQHFKVQNGQVLMDCYAVKTAATTVLNDPTATPEQHDNAQRLLDQVNDLDHNEWH